MSKRARITDIMTLAANMSGVPVADLKGPRRRTDIVRIRWAITIVARMQTPQHSYPEIARVLRKDHSTLVHGVQRYNARFADDEKFAAFIAELAKAASETAAFVAPKQLIKLAEPKPKPQPVPYVPPSQEDRDEDAGRRFFAGIRDGSNAFIEALRGAA